MRRLACLWAFASVSIATQALAQTGKYQITEAEKAACTPDAEKLCADAYPDEDKLFSCMKANRKALTSACRIAFDAGVKKRGLN